MEELSMDEACTQILSDFFEELTDSSLEGIDDVEAEIEELVEGAFLEIDNYSQDSNNIFLLAGVPLSNGKRFSINANLIWSQEHGEWISFFDGNGPDDAYFEPDGEGGYRIVGLD